MNKPPKLPEGAEDQPRAASKSANPRLKGGYFLTGKGSGKDLFLSEDWSEEQLMIRDLIVEFCTSEIQEPMARRGRELQVTKEEDRQEVATLIRKAGELGLCGVSIPEEYGGMGLDFKTNTLFSEHMALGFSFATTIGAQTSIGCLPIVYYGNEAQKQKYLPGIATGERIAAYALTEPEAGSDANSGRSSAELAPGGDHYLLNGQKIWITNGGFADVFIVFARFAGDENLSAFIVERDFPGFSVGPEEQKMGIKGSSTVQIYFDNCQVPLENLLGKRNEGFKMALNILNGGRIKAGAGGVGGSKFAIGKAAAYAAERKQFGKPIGDFGAIQYKIGDLCMQTFAIEAALYRTAHLIDLKTEELLAAGLPESEAKLQAMREFAVEASLIKVKGSDLVCYATDETIQIFGGMGYAQETGIEMGYRDARITKIYEGTNEVNRLLSVGELAKHGLQTKEIDLRGAINRIPAFVFNTMNPFRSKSGYAPEERAIQALKNTFLLIFAAAGRKLGKKLIDEQEILLHLANMLADAYVAESVLLKVETLEKRPDQEPEKLQIQKQAMQLYLYHALGHTRKTSREVVASFATGTQAKFLFSLINRMLAGYHLNPKQRRRNIAQYVIREGRYAL